MNQQELRTLTRERLKDAKALLGRKRWSFAYYVAGYAVECALKACVLKQMVNTGWVFVPATEGKGKKSLQDVLTHDFETLLRIAGLWDRLLDDLETSSRTNTRFGGFWAVTRRWTVDARYVVRTRDEAEALFAAITDRTEGVLRWIRKFW